MFTVSASVTKLLVEQESKAKRDYGTTRGMPFIVPWSSCKVKSQSPANGWGRTQAFGFCLADMNNQKRLTKPMQQDANPEDRQGRNNLF